MQKTQKNLPTAIWLVKVRNNQNKNPVNQHFIGTCAKQSPRAHTIQSQVTKQQNFEARNVAFVERSYHFIGCNYQFFIEDLSPNIKLNVIVPVNIYNIELYVRR